MPSLKFRNAPASSVVRPPISATSPGSRISRRSKPSQNEALVRLNQEDVSDPSHLNRALSDVQAAVQRSTAAMRTSPIMPGVLFQAQAVTANTTTVLNHGMARPYRGIMVTLASVYTLVPKVIPLTDPSVPQGLNVSTHIAFQLSSTGTYDLYVF